MRKFIAFFLKYTSLVALALFGIIVIGWSTYTSLARESFPQIKIPYIIVQTIYRGVAPADMETLVTKPLETKLKSVSGIKKISSTSGESFSGIFLEFNPEINIESALQKVRDKVSQAKTDLPSDIEDPEVKEISFDEVPVMIISLSGDYGLNKLKDVADELKDEIESISGVLGVNVIGGYTREIQIIANPARMNAYGLSYDTFNQTLAAANINIPGGSLDIGKRSYLVRIPNDYLTVKEIANTPITTYRGAPVRIKDIATVKDTHRKITSISRMNRRESVTITIQKRAGANIIKLSEEIKAIIEKKHQELPHGTNIQYTTDMSKEIEEQVDDMENTFVFSLILVIGVLYMFMGFRNAAIVATIIPISMLITFIVIGMMGFTLNFMVLFSLTMLLGMLVDTAIVVVENIYRMINNGVERQEAAEAGAAEVLIPILTSTLTTVFAFLPLAFWPGMVGQFMRYMPITVTIGLSASFLVAIIFNPVMSKMFIKKHVPGDDLGRQTLPQKVDAWLEKFKETHYDRWLNWALDNTKKVIFWAVMAFIASIVVIGTIPKEFFPETAPDQFYIDIKMPPGTRLTTTDKVVQRIEKILAENQNIDRYVANVGNTGAGGKIFGGGNDDPTIARISVELKDKWLLSESGSEIMDRIRTAVSSFSGAEIKVDKPKDGPPAGEPISITIAGEDFIVLDKLGEQVKQIMRETKGVVNIRDNLSTSRPEIHVTIDRDKAAVYGFAPIQLAAEVRNAFNGTTATKYRDKNDEYDVVVKLDESEKQSLTTLRNITVRSRTGAHVPISKVAEVKISAGLNTIEREDYDRIINVTAATDSDTKTFVALSSIKKKVNALKLPAGYTVKYTGEDEEMGKNFAFLGSAFRIALLLILITLVAQFNSFYVPMIVMITIVLSVVGMAFGLKVMGQSFGLMAFIGLISLAGVAVNNGIVLLDFVQNLQGRGNARKQAIIEAAKIRLRPVMLTAIATALGLLPIIIGVSPNFKKMKIDVGASSLAFWKPMASVIFFGLLVSTVLTLIIIPAIYYQWDKYREEKKLRKAAAKQ